MMGKRDRPKLEPAEERFREKRGVIDLNGAYRTRSEGEDVDAASGGEHALKSASKLRAS
jgi:hypothetical protein